MPFPLFSKMNRFFYVLVSLGLALGIAFVFYAFQPVGVGSDQVLVDIPRGTSFKHIVGRLEAAGLITNRPFFYVLAVAKGAARQIRAGEHELSYA
ncbi:MAG: hypothetical protein N2Z74_02370, partial [Syntrophales bacterium]|nr:hypothetical protein [Syntrophales bacterium]